MGKLYMHINTGSVDTLDGWIDDIGENYSKEDFEFDIKSGIMIEVVKTKDGYEEVK